MSVIQSPSTSSDKSSSDDLSFEDITLDEVHYDDIPLNTVEEINDAISKYKDMILETERCSNERKLLVRRIIELRYKLEILKENQTQTQDDENEIVLGGHHFVLTKIPVKWNSKANLKRCDVCCGYVTLLGLIVPWYECSGCQYRTHTKCVSSTRRTCAFTKAGENPMYELNICPEITLLQQKYKCHECKTPIIFENNSWADPRLCDYDGRYYCTACHWMDEAVIPARVLLNWDFEKQPVSRANAQLLKIMIKRPTIDVHDINSKLFGFVEELAKVKKYREDLLKIKQYLITCRVASEANLLWVTMGNRQNLIKYNSHTFSLKDLIDIKSNVLTMFLENTLETLLKHIKQECKVCFGRGYICELCNGKKVIFPFDESVYVCKLCQTVYHKHCWLHKNVCNKCERIKKRNSQVLNEDVDEPDLGEEVKVHQSNLTLNLNEIPQEENLEEVDEAVEIMEDFDR